MSELSMLNAITKIWTGSDCDTAEMLWDWGGRWRSVGGIASG